MLHDDGLVFSAPLMRSDRITELHGEWQAAEVLREAPGDAAEGVFGEISTTYDLQHDGSVGTLHGLKLPNSLSARVAEEHVKHDPGHLVSLFVDERVGASPVDVRELS